MVYTNTLTTKCKLQGKCVHQHIVQVDSCQLSTCPTHTDNQIVAEIHGSLQLYKGIVRQSGVVSCEFYSIVNRAGHYTSIHTAIYKVRS